MMGTVVGGGGGVTEAKGGWEDLAFLALTEDGERARAVIGLRVRLRPYLLTEGAGAVAEVVLGCGVVTGCSARFFVKF